MLLRMILATWLMTYLSLGCAAAQEAHAAQPATDAAKALSSDSSVDQILDALDRRGRDLKSLTADVKMVETDQAIGDETTRTGHVWLDNRNDGATRFRAKDVPGLGISSIFTVSGGSPCLGSSFFTSNWA